MTLVNHTDNEVTLDWFPPTDNGGDEISYYELNCTASTGGSQLVSLGVPSQTRPVKGQELSLIHDLTIEHSNR